MKLQNQVCTIEQGKRLAELGVNPFGSYFCYSGNEKSGFEVVPIVSLEDDGDGNVGHASPAFTVAELGAALPTEYTAVRTNENTAFNGYWWMIETDFSNECEKCMECLSLIKTATLSSTQASAMASMITHLLETGILTASEVNECINNA